MTSGYRLKVTARHLNTQTVLIFTNSRPHQQLGEQHVEVRLQFIHVSTERTHLSQQLQHLLTQNTRTRSVRAQADNGDRLTARLEASAHLQLDVELSDGAGERAQIGQDVFTEVGDKTSGMNIFLTYRKKKKKKRMPRQQLRSNIQYKTNHQHWNNRA